MSRPTASPKRRLAEIVAVGGRLTYPRTGSSAVWMGKIIVLNVLGPFPTDLVYGKQAIDESREEGWEEERSFAATLDGTWTGPCASPPFQFNRNPG